jgi:S1-C subfamily serine protease
MSGRHRVALAALAVAAPVLAACGGGGGGGDGSGQGGSPSSGRTTTRVEVIERSAPGGTFNPERIYREEAQGVVTVVSLFGGSGLDDLLGDGSGGGGGGGEGVGSGFVLNAGGEIATNTHVVVQGTGDAMTRAREVYVEFADGNRVPAKIVGTDPNADVALLRVPTGGLRLRPIPLGSSDGVAVGEPVAAIGSPFAEDRSLSVGVVSAVDRSIESLTDFQIPGAVQTDAAINPGNSGGPLIDARGQVIGINEQIKTNSGGGEGVGFAVPVDLVKRSLTQLRANGEASYAYLGVSTAPVYPQLAEHFDLGAAKGAWVQSVTAGGPAANGELRGGTGEERFQAQAYRTGGDVITRVAGRPIATPDDLAVALARFRPGDTVTIQVHRDGATRSLRVKLTERPSGSPQPTGG